MYCMFDHPFFLSLSTTKRLVNVPLFGWFSPCKYLLLSILLLALVYVNPVNAEWGREPGDNILLNGAIPHLVSDSAGGAYLLSQTGLVQVDRYGCIQQEQWWIPYHGEYYYRAWNILPADNSDLFVKLEVGSDEWDQEDEWGRPVQNAHGYLQRYNRNGEILWGEEGIQVSPRRTSNHVDRMLSDGENGLIIIIIERDYSEGNPDPPSITYAARLSPEGEQLWEVELEGRWLGPIVSDGEGGFIYLYSQPRKIKVQRTDSEGEILWSIDSLAIEPYNWESGSASKEDIISDGQGGLIMVNGFFYRQGDIVGVYLMRLSGDGDVVWSQVIYEREFWEVGRTYDPPTMLTKVGQDQYFAAWKDYGSGECGAMRFNDDGELLWDSYAILGDSLASRGRFVGVAGINSVNYVWQNSIENISTIKGQQVSLEGEKMWEFGGVTLDSGWHYTMTITSDCNGGAIIATDSFPIELYMVNRNGELGIVLDDYVPDITITTPVEFDILIYPQPANAILRLDFTSHFPINGSIGYKIFDVAGRLYQSGSLTKSSLQTLSLTNLPTGSYFLQFDSQTAILNRKVTIQK